MPTAPDPGPDPLDYLANNVALWTGKAADQRDLARRNWSRTEPVWGIFAIPESELGLLPADARGRRALELGCGTAYVSAWLARRGAHCVGLDPTPSQLQIAGELQAEFGLRFPLVHAAAEHLPFADDTFDLAVSEYGAAIWADPYFWVPEAARVLRPGGELVVLGNSALLVLCETDEFGTPAREELLRPLFGLHRFEWTEPDSVEFHVSHGDWIRLFRSCGFEVLDLLELRPDVGATTRYTHVSYDWARRWPCEEVWRARLSG
jgi:SAM-dependent methyltransferase